MPVMSIGFIIEPEQPSFYKVPAAGRHHQAIFRRYDLVPELDCLSSTCLREPAIFSSPWYRPFPSQVPSWSLRPRKWRSPMRWKAMNMFLMPSVNVPSWASWKNMSWFTPRGIAWQQNTTFGQVGERNWRRGQYQPPGQVPIANPGIRRRLPAGCPPGGCPRHRCLHERCGKYPKQVAARNQAMGTDQHCQDQYKTKNYASDKEKQLSQTRRRALNVVRPTWR